MSKYGKIMYRFEIEIKESGEIKKSNSELKIIASKGYGDKNDLIVLEGIGYTILQTKKEKYCIHTVFNNPGCFENKWNSRSIYLKDKIVGYLYTTNSSEKWGYKRVKKAIEKYVKKEYGKYGNYVDILSRMEEL